MSRLVIIGRPGYTSALRTRLEADPEVTVFEDTDSLEALKAILTTHPRIVALNATFATTARGAGLVARLRGESHLAGVDLRLLMEDENREPLLLADTTGSSEQALLENSWPLDRVGTRAALRYVVDRLPITINGERSLLIDLSITGAQVLLPTRVRPAEPVRVVLADELGEMRCTGTVVWSAAVPVEGRIQYRAGLRLTAPNPKWLEGYCVRHGGRPDHTFGGV